MRCAGSAERVFAMLPPVAPPRFQERIGGPLVSILRLYVALITLVVMGLTTVAAYLHQRSEVEYQRQKVLLRLTSEVTSQAGEISALAASPLMWAGLMDGEGRDAYLTPLLERLNRDGARRFHALDHRGRALIAPNRQPQAETEAIASDAAVVAAVREGRDSYGLRMTDRGEPQILLVHRVMNPNTDTVVGFIVAVVDVSTALRFLRIEPGVAVSVGVGDLALAPPPQSGWRISTEASATAAEGDLSVPLRVWVGVPILTSMLFAAAGVIVALILGGWTIHRVRAWVERFATATTQRLDRLLLECQKILAGERLEAVEPGPNDELAQVTSALNAMLRKQKQITDDLRTTSLVFATAAEGILVTNPQGQVVEVNAALLGMTGYTRADLLGQPAGTLYRNAVDPDVSPQMVSALAETGRWNGETTFLGRDGRLISASVALSRIRTEEGEVLGNVAVITDISRLKKIEHQLRDQANQDALTGLPNFRHMAEEAQLALAQARSDARKLALVFIDLDNFKTVNDDLGHDAGDTVVKAVASNLVRRLPQGHLLCRRSGDEFIALVDRSECEDVVLTHLLNRLTPLAIATEAGQVTVTATTGVSRFPEDATDWQGLQLCADIAMNEAKQERRGSLVWYDDRIGRRRYRRRQIQARLHDAIRDSAFDIHYQPEVDLHTGQVVGLEALARWHDQELGSVSPAEFVAAAEEARVMDSFTLCIAELVLRDKPRLQARFPGAVVAFNASPQVFRRSRLLDFLLGWSQRSPGILEGLEIELTETEISRSDANLQLQVQAVVALGVRLVIDDFGTGYSSLSRLTQFPIGRLKIDRSFVDGMDRTPERRIARLIVDLARALGLEVTAEGVETVDQRRELRLMGCHRGQGWLFGPAVPASVLLASDSPVNFPAE